MTQSPIPGLVCRMAVPTIISMLTTSFYNMADTYFVSQIGTSASGAVGVVFSLMALIQACGFTLGVGSGSVVARLLGAKERQPQRGSPPRLLDWRLASGCFSRFSD
jgi:Na+-driven multidrug efflux pump